MCTEGERLGYGQGDLRLPVGWGDMPWQVLMWEYTLSCGVVFNIALNRRYWYAAERWLLPQRLSLERAHNRARYCRIDGQHLRIG